jgi:hypothetical protein
MRVCRQQPLLLVASTNVFSTSARARSVLLPACSLSSNFR